MIKTFDIIQTYFKNLPQDSKNENEVIFFFGVDSLNRDEVNYWDPSDLGQVKFSDNLDISSIEGQKSLKQFCKRLKEADFVSGSQVSCWFDSFEKYID